jgi:proteasome lid subunit RPN8/RPN11
MRAVQIPQTILDAIVTQARAEQPNECCGLLAGIMTDGIAIVSRHYPLVNELASPTLFRGDARGQLHAMNAMRADSAEWLAVYHSHPASAAVPSARDREWSVGPDIACVIVSLADATPDIRVWWLTATTAEPGRLLILDDDLNPTR